MPKTTTPLQSSNKNPNSSQQTTQRSRLLSGRFEHGTSNIMQNINASIAYDKRLYREDIAGSLAHIRMLAKQKIVSQDDCNVIINGLKSIEEEISNGEFQFKQELEDIHMNVEARLIEKIGPPGAKLHTARSRNDQVATDMRLWLRNQIDDLKQLLHHLISQLCDQALEHADTPMPGYTHLQVAQPVTFGHHMIAYIEMFSRDYGRLCDTQKRLNECPLGAAALAGTSFAIDRIATSSELGFDKPMANSMDSVSARDFILEFLACASICAIHLSRLGEEIVIWSSASFNFITLSDEFSTGSSIMPQKRNPDAAELIRAKPGRILGSFINLATILKGLPMTYAKDLQEDKEPLFDACDTLALAINAAAGMIGDLVPNKDNMLKALELGYPTATDLADWLVREKNFTFRDAHHITGQIVKLAETKNCKLEELSLDEMHSVALAITKDVYNVLRLESALKNRCSLGGTAPALVKQAALEWKNKLETNSI